MPHFSAEADIRSSSKCILCPTRQQHIVSRIQQHIVSRKDSLFFCVFDAGSSASFEGEPQGVGRNRSWLVVGQHPAPDPSVKYSFFRTSLFRTFPSRVVVRIMTKRLSRQASPPSPERRARSRTRTDNGAAMTEPQDVEFPADKRTIVPDDLIVWGREQQEARAAAAKATFKTVAQLAAEKKERDAAIAAAKAAGLPPPFGQPLKGFAPSFAKPKAPPKGKERAGGAGKGGVKGTGVPAKGAGATATAPVGKIGQQHPNMSSLGGTKGGRAPADPRQPQQPAKIAKNEVAGGTVPKQPAAAAVASSAFLPAKEATASAQVGLGCEPMHMFLCPKLVSCLCEGEHILSVVRSTSSYGGHTTHIVTS